MGTMASSGEEDDSSEDTKTRRSAEEEDGSEDTNTRRSGRLSEERLKYLRQLQEEQLKNPSDASNKDQSESDDDSYCGHEVPAKQKEHAELTEEEKAIIKKHVDQHFKDAAMRGEKPADVVDDMMLTMLASTNGGSTVFQKKIVPYIVSAEVMKIDIFAACFNST